MWFPDEFNRKEALHRGIVGSGFSHENYSGDYDAEDYYYIAGLPMMLHSRKNLHLDFSKISLHGKLMGKQHTLVCK